MCERVLPWCLVANSASESPFCLRCDGIAGFTTGGVGAAAGVAGAGVVIVAAGATVLCV